MNPIGSNFYYLLLSKTLLLSDQNTSHELCVQSTCRSESMLYELFLVNFKEGLAKFTIEVRVWLKGDFSGLSLIRGCI